MCAQLTFGRLPLAEHEGLAVKSRADNDGPPCQKTFSVLADALASKRNLRMYPQRTCKHLQQHQNDYGIFPDDFPLLWDTVRSQILNYVCTDASGIHGSAYRSHQTRRIHYETMPTHQAMSIRQRQATLRQRTAELQLGRTRPPTFRNQLQRST